MRSWQVAVVAVVSFLSFPMGAWGYSIDGDDSDWVSGYQSENIDGQDNGGGVYDIYVNRSSYQDGVFYFYFRTMGPYQNTNPGDHAEIWLNVDGDTSTGSSGPESGLTGYEYFMSWDLSSFLPDGQGGYLPYGEATVYHYNGTSWDQLTEVGLVSRGASTHTGYTDNMFTEWSLARSVLGNPDPDLVLWGAFLEDGSTAPDDLCPDTLDQPSTPEPGTMSLMLLAGLPFLFRRKRKSS